MKVVTTYVTVHHPFEKQTVRILLIAHFRKLPDAAPLQFGTRATVATFPVGRGRLRHVRHTTRCVGPRGNFARRGARVVRVARLGLRKRGARLTAVFVAHQYVPYSRALPRAVAGGFRALAPGLPGADRAGHRARGALAGAVLHELVVELARNAAVHALLLHGVGALPFPVAARVRTVRPRGPVGHAVHRFARLCALRPGRARVAPGGGVLHDGVSLRLHAVHRVALCVVPRPPRDLAVQRALGQGAGLGLHPLRGARVALVGAVQVRGTRLRARAAPLVALGPFGVGVGSVQTLVRVLRAAPIAVLAPPSVTQVIKAFEPVVYVVPRASLGLARLYAFQGLARARLLVGQHLAGVQAGSGAAMEATPEHVKAGLLVVRVTGAPGPLGELALDRALGERALLHLVVACGAAAVLCEQGSRSTLGVRVAVAVALGPLAERRVDALRAGHRPAFVAVRVVCISAFVAIIATLPPGVLHVAHLVPSAGHLACVHALEREALVVVLRVTDVGVGQDVAVVHLGPGTTRRAHVPLELPAGQLAVRPTPAGLLPLAQHAHGLHGLLKVLPVGGLALRSPVLAGHVHCVHLASALPDVGTARVVPLAPPALARDRRARAGARRGAGLPTVQGRRVHGVPLVAHAVLGRTPAVVPRPPRDLAGHRRARAGARRGAGLPTVQGPHIHRKNLLPHPVRPAAAGRVPLLRPTALAVHRLTRAALLQGRRARAAAVPGLHRNPKRAPHRTTVLRARGDVPLGPRALAGHRRAGVDALGVGAPAAVSGLLEHAEGLPPRAPVGGTLGLVPRTPRAHAVHRGARPRLARGLPGRAVLRIAGAVLVPRARLPVHPSLGAGAAGGVAPLGLPGANAVHRDAIVLAVHLTRVAVPMGPAG